MKIVVEKQLENFAEYIKYPFYNKKFLSEIKISNHNTSKEMDFSKLTKSKTKNLNNLNRSRYLFYLTDTKTNLESFIDEFDDQCILMGLPFVLNIRSKVSYPFVLKKLMNNLNLILRKTINFGIFTSVKIHNFVMDSTDFEYYDDRILFLSEADNIEIYDKITKVEKFFEDKNYLKFMSFLYPVVDSFMTLNKLNKNIKLSDDLDDFNRMSSDNIKKYKNASDSNISFDKNMINSQDEHTKKNIFSENFSCLNFDFLPSGNKLSTSNTDQNKDVYFDYYDNFSAYNGEYYYGLESARNSLNNNLNDSNLNAKTSYFIDSQSDKNKSFVKSNKEFNLSGKVFLSSLKKLSNHINEDNKYFCGINSENFDEKNKISFKNSKNKNTSKNNPDSSDDSKNYKIKKSSIKTINPISPYSSPNGNSVKLQNKYSFGKFQISQKKKIINFETHDSKQKYNIIEKLVNENIQESSRRNLMNLEDLNNYVTPVKKPTNNFSFINKPTFSNIISNAIINNSNSIFNNIHLSKNKTPLKIEPIIQEISSLECSSNANEESKNEIENDDVNDQDYMNYLSDYFETGFDNDDHYDSHAYFNNQYVFEDFSKNQTHFPENKEILKDNQKFKIESSQNYLPLDSKIKNNINKIFENIITEKQSNKKKIDFNSVKMKSNKKSIISLEKHLQRSLHTHLNSIFSSNKIDEGKFNFNDFQTLNLEKNNQMIKLEDVNLKLNYLQFESESKRFRKILEKLPLEIFTDKTFIELSFKINKMEEIHYFDKKLKKMIILIDEDFSYCINYLVCEFFSYWIHYYKNLKRDEEEKKEQDLIEINENISIEKKIKPLLKPFNKEEILYQKECETDYGDKKMSRKEILHREKYVEKAIKNANYMLYQSVDSDLVRGRFGNNVKKVTFLIPNDRFSIFNKLN